MWTTFKTYLSAILAGLFALLAGAAFYQKRRADRNAKEIEELEDQMQANDINNEVKEFQAINNERKDVVDEKISDVNSTDTSDGTYRL